jgi:hypothetical protein
VKELKVNMLIENDILRSEEIIIDIQQKTAIICSCQNMIIEIKIHQRKSFVRKNIINQFVNIISLESYAKISYKVKNLSEDRDFLFESSSEVSIFIYAHVIDARITEIMMRNEFERIMKISKNFKLKMIQDIQYDDCFYASQKHHLALQIFKKNQMKKALTVDIAIDRFRALSKNSKIQVAANQIDEKSEEKISFDVTVYENEREKQKFDRLINEFSKI